jgi:hypothetical protein
MTDSIVRVTGSGHRHYEEAKPTKQFTSGIRGCFASLARTRMHFGHLTGVAMMSLALAISP